MASPTNTYTTYTARGQAEDVDNKIYNLDPEETPFASAADSEQVHSKNPQWQEDNFFTPNKDNAAVEGDDFSGRSITPTFVLTNTMQTIREDIVTSGINNAIKKYGRGQGANSEQDYQNRKAMIAVKRHAEAAMLSNNIGVVGNTTTAAKMAGLELYADQNAQSGVGGSTVALTNGTLPTVAPTDGTTRALTSAIFTTACQTMWQAGVKPKVAYLSMAQKAAVNGFTSIASQRNDTPPSGLAKIIGAVDVYVWETGPIAFVPIYNTQIRSRTMFLTDGESVKRAFIRPIQKSRMGPTGDNTKDMLVTDVTLKVTNRRGVMKIADLT
jgi:Family of unknown function (DUF5309)